MEKTIKENPKEEEPKCPLYERTISSGKCLDVNFERLRFLRDGAFRALARVRGKSVEELHEICKNCPKQPFPDDNIGEVKVRRRLH